MIQLILRFKLLPMMLIVLLNACSSIPEERDSLNLIKQDQTLQLYKSLGHDTYNGVFLKPAALVNAVDFWRKTYSVWQRSQVAIHDNRHLDVVYEVLLLPGVVDENLTNEQKDMLNQRKDYWRAYLAALETKLRNGVTLNTDEMQLIAKLEQSGKPASFINGASDRVRSQRGIRERFKRGLEISGRYDQQFRKIFRDAGLPEDLAYLPHVESSFQPAAKSSAGAIGLWQFTKAAAKTFMSDGGSIDRRLDPVASTYGAARYLSYAYRKLGDWPTVLTSYNHGIGGMKRAQNQLGNNFVRIVEQYDGPSFGFASRNYYAQFLAALEIASNPKHYFSEGINYEGPLETKQYLAVD
jgi:membrane-bound lytic murein transglycosylase D